VLNAVLGAGEATRTFYVTPNFWASSLTPVVGATPISVMQLDFQTILDDFAPTLLVIDIEGGEAELLSKSDLTGVRALLLEVHPHQIEPDAMSRLFGHLMDQGLKIDLRASSGYVYLFRRTAHAKSLD